MLNLIYSLVSKIVFLGLNGTSLIIPFCILLYFVDREIEDVEGQYKKVFGREV